MTDKEIAAVWDRYAAQTKACCEASRAASAALDGVTGNAPQLGSSEAERSAWRLVMQTQAAHAVATHLLRRCSADLVYMIEAQNNLAEVAEHVSTTALMN